MCSAPCASSKRRAFTGAVSGPRARWLPFYPRFHRGSLWRARPSRSRLHRALGLRAEQPHAASKAGGDHLVRARLRTYGFPAIVTYCCNNYGPYEFPEKLIPLMLLNALKGKSLLVYGDGWQVRDWLHVDDHARAVLFVLKSGQPGQIYAIGGRNEIRNLDLVHRL